MKMGSLIRNKANGRDSKIAGKSVTSLQFPETISDYFMPFS